MDLPSSPLAVEARPAPFAMDPGRTAVVVVDMQNDFASEGGAFARRGNDIAPIRDVVAPISRVLAAARGAGMRVVYLKIEFRPDLSDLGAPGSKFWEVMRFVGIGNPVAGPDDRPSRVFIEDTWNTDIVGELRPEPRHRCRQATVQRLLRDEPGRHPQGLGRPGPEAQSLQWFLSKSRWDPREVNERRLGVMLDECVPRRGT